jgi:hypothetical protein
MEFLWMKGIEIEGFIPFVFDLTCQTHDMRKELL